MFENNRYVQIDEWIFDGAHNHESLMALKRVLESLELYDLIGVFGALKDKDFDEALEALKPHFKQIIVTEPLSFRKLEASQMADRLKKVGYLDVIVESDIHKAYLLANALEGTKIGFGSFYMISELRKQII